MTTTGFAATARMRDGAPPSRRDELVAGVERSVRGSEEFFAANADAVADCAVATADRFFGGATLFIFGGGVHVSDAQHNAVEFLHPALPGCRALPAVALNNDVATVTGMLAGDARDDVYAHQLRVLGRRGDIVLGFVHGCDAASVHALAAAHDLGMLTIVLSSGSVAAELRADHRLHVRQDQLAPAHELQLAAYHMLWELVHIALNHRGIPDRDPSPQPEAAAPVCDDARCVTCSDQLLEVRVTETDTARAIAVGTADGALVEVSTELIDSVSVGDVLLCQGGVALQRGTLEGGGRG